MPKKVNRRPVRTNARPRQTGARTAGATPVLDQEPVLATPAAEAPAATTVSAPPPPATTRPAAPSARRAPPSARKTPTLTVNYGYLRHDLTLLAVLAVSMIVLVLVAYIFLH